MHHQGDWHGHDGIGAFTSSQQAYDTLHIGDPKQAAKLQAGSRQESSTNDETEDSETE